MKTQPDRDATARPPASESVQDEQELNTNPFDETATDDAEYFENLMEHPPVKADLDTEPKLSEVKDAEPNASEPETVITQVAGQAFLPAASEQVSQPPQSLLSASLTVDPEADMLQMYAPEVSKLLAPHQSSQSFDSGSEFSGQEQSPEPFAISTLGDEILDGLNKQGTSTQSATEPSASNRLVQFVDQVAERILVTDSSSSTDQQVRLIIKDSLLPQTEVLLSRDGAVLVVQFVTRSEEASVLLAAKQHLIQEQLTESLNRPVSVDVSTEQHDGRSRGQRDIFAELAEEEQ